MPEHQTLFGYPHGNCVEACVAAIVGVSVAEVPDPRADANLHTLNAPQAFAYRWPAMEAWLAARGLSVIHGTGKPPAMVRASGMPWIATGPSPRNPKAYGHAVVYRGDSMTWDPHPSGAGIKGQQGWHVIAPSTEALTRKA